MLVVLRNLFTFFIMVIIILPGLQAQNFGGVPSGKSWMRKGNDHIQMIYSPYAQGIADRIISIVDRINRTDPYSLGPGRAKVHIVLRNENLTTNGFVGYVPFRSEFYLYGAQNPNVLGYNDWIRLLTVHEYRHVIQYSNLRRGVFRAARDLFGDAAFAGIFNLLVPDWFAEGDAVYYESALTGNGRGQLPAFSTDLRALLLDNKNYSYWKYANGSFKNFVPNHYVHGYMLTSYGYNHYHDTFWKDILYETSRLKGLFTPFRKAIQRTTGKKLTDYHDQVMNEYQEILYSHLDTSAIVDHSVFPHSLKIKNELQFIPHSPGRSYLLENSYDEISTVYEITDNKRKKAFTLGRTSDPYLVLRDSRLFFINQTVDPRWTNREYGDIYYYDITSKKVNRVTHKEKFLAVDYQGESNQYLTVEAGQDGFNRIVVISGASGQKDSLLYDPDTYYSYPQWDSENSNQLIYSGRKNGQMFLNTYHIPSGKQDTLVGPVRETISRPWISGAQIYFSSSRSGIDNIYSYDRNTRKITPVTDDIIGAYNPTLSSIQKDTLYYSANRSSGQRIHKVSLKEKTIRRSTPTLPRLQKLNTAGRHNPLNFFDMETDTTHIPGQKYGRIGHLFHFHSLYLEPSTTQPRLSLLSNDYLNTMKASLYGQVYKVDRSYEGGAEITYGGWYPELFINGNHRLNRKLNIQVGDKLYTIPKSETSIQAGVALPLNFSNRQKNHQFRLSGQYGWTQEHFDPVIPGLPGKINAAPRLFQTGQLNTHWSLQRLRAYRDIFPRWGLTTQLVAKQSYSPAESWMLYGRQAYFIPGFFQNDGFKIKWQTQWNSNLASNYLPLELRTVNDLSYDASKVQFAQIYTINYLTPVAYPELNIPHLVYTKRLAINIFTEYFHSKPFETTWSGIDLFLTARYFQLFDFTAGLRLYKNWGLKKEPVKWSLVFLHDL